MGVPDVDHEYVRTICASSDIFEEDLEPSGDLHIHIVINTIPTYAYKTLVCALYQKAHVSRILELTQRIQRTY